MTMPLKSIKKTKVRHFSFAIWVLRSLISKRCYIKRTWGEKPLITINLHNLIPSERTYTEERTALCLFTLQIKDRWSILFDTVECAPVWFTHYVFQLMSKHLMRWAKRRYPTVTVMTIGLATEELIPQLPSTPTWAQPSLLIALLSVRCSWWTEHPPQNQSVQMPFLIPHHQQGMWVKN